MSTPAIIVDYGLGNIFSIVEACRSVGLTVEVSDTPERIQKAPLVILPGVGAFGDAMEALRTRNLIGALKEFAGSGKPLFGICLGMQLLMDESCEFGSHHGLGLIPGTIERLARDGGLKVPQIGWAGVRPAAGGWAGTPLFGIEKGEYFYFVHSFHVRPRDQTDVCAVSRFGSLEYCSAVRRDSVFGVQFHPERSGPAGLAVYRNLLQLASNATRVSEKV